MRLKFYKDLSGNIFEFRERGLYKRYEGSSNDEYAQMLVDEINGNAARLDLTRERREQYMLKQNLGIC